MRDVIVIGDVHGDGDRLVHAIQRLRLGNAEGEWIGGNVSLVILGDVLDGKDRGTGEWSTSKGDFEAVLYLEDLRRSAESQRRGRVTCLLGNHEMMNMLGEFSYVSSIDLKRNGGVAGRTQKLGRFGLIGSIIRRWRRSYVENHTLFCHAGVATASADAIQTSSDVTVRDCRHIPDSDIMEHRQYAYDTDASSPERAKLMRMLERCDCRQMMIGHNSVDTITPTWGGAVVMADACLSRAYGESRSIWVVCIRPSGFWEPIEIKLH